MVVKNEIAKVWLIENNKLQHTNKVISKIDYKGTEIAVLKTEINNEYLSLQELLIKDENNEYWKINAIGVNFKHFINASIDNTLVESREYCESFMRALSKVDLKEVFTKKVEQKRYFNLCELQYISKHYPEIYDDALICRNNIKEKNEEQSRKEMLDAKLKREEKVKKINEEFEKKLEEIKLKIRIGKCVETEYLQFYKDNNYDNGITTQNCFLYLAKQYGIKIPLATQGFINNRLVDYDFTTGNYSYKILNNNKRTSTKINEYLGDIYKKVNEEFQKQTLELKEKIKRVMEAR